ncbi:hypothetical protein AGMMS4957_02370 [Bacteroidia bacterium]|nr:hypothetical protein AGMMS4957_02370 [Bacteroidia bacterium]
MTIREKTIFAFADTHGKHREINIPSDTDIVVFAGDACEAGDQEQLTDFFDWFAALPVKHKLFVPGNHDLPFEFSPEFAVRMVPRNVTFIEQGEITLDGIRFYVLPVRPWLHEPLPLPSGVDVLITHGAPKGILDGGGQGCPILMELVDAAHPQIHLFGHSHLDGGKSLQMGDTLFCNVAMKGG